MTALSDRAYHVHVGSLKEGEHLLTYCINSSFFQKKDSRAWKDIAIDVSLKIRKHHDFFQSVFELHGIMDTLCDRCMADLPLTIWDEFEVTFKYSWNPHEENEQEEDPFVYYLKMGESFWDAKSWIYDFILLSIPSVKKCVGKDEEAQTYCNQAVLKYLV